MNNRVVIVTGASNGIGRTIVKAYAGKQFSVIIADIDKKNGNLLEQELIKSGKNALFVGCDVSVPDDISKLVEKVMETYGRIDVVINNAGLGKWKSPFELDVNEWDYVINTNLRGTFLLSREAVKVMKGQEWGSIVNIASTRALMSEPDSEAYAASKAGILGLTHALAASLSKYKIQVNAISPGWIETGDYSKLRKIDHKQHFAGRVGKPGDIARACLFLTDPENNFISGTNLVIDGGMTKKMIYEPDEL
ncbi:MAG: SDR family oxidoreductase [Paludibacter sp.]|nr:SDR family oxidoreductase [Paludibacter sp.]